MKQTKISKIKILVDSWANSWVWKSYFIGWKDKHVIVKPFKGGLTTFDAKSPRAKTQGIRARSTRQIHCPSEVIGRYSLSK